MLRTYFKSVRIEGIENVPKNVPLLVTPNHQNALLDPLIVGAFIPIPLHFLTRSDVFKPWNKPILKLVNMMPIYRIRDGYKKLGMNDAIFEACREIFRTNGSVLIFAEGNHGEHHYLRPLTKGAARIALQSQMDMESDLMVLPVGLNFFDHQATRSTVRVVFGEPVAVRQHVDAYKKHAAKGLIQMRDAIADGMRKTLAIPDPTDDYEARKRSIFNEENAQLKLDDLRQVAIKDDRPKSGKKKHLLARFFNPVPFLIIHRVLSNVEDIVFHSSLKFAIGLVAFPIWWLIVFLLIYSFAGIHIAVLALMVMIMSLFYSYQ